MCNPEVHFFLTLDYQKMYGHYLKEMLNEGLSVLIYNGDKDFICNWKGGEAWTEALVWDYQDEFNKGGYKSWGDNAELKEALTSSPIVEVGQFKNYENFTFLRLFDAGHMVPMDQPERAYKMINEFIENGKLIPM